MPDLSSKVRSVISQLSGERPGDLASTSKPLSRIFVLFRNVRRELLELIDKIEKRLTTAESELDTHTHPDHNHEQTWSTSAYVESPSKNTVLQLFGSMEVQSAAVDWSGGGTRNLDNGVSKMVFVQTTVTIGGNVVLSGTSVNRDTGVETPADTETVTLGSLSTDNSGNDANGNNAWDISNAVITSKWWKGRVVATPGASMQVTSDVYSVAFSQANDVDEFTIDTIDPSVRVTALGAGNAKISVYLYKVDVERAAAEITPIATVVLDAADLTYEGWYRMRRAVGEALEGFSDGWFLNVYMNGAGSGYFEHFSVEIWKSKDTQ